MSRGLGWVERSALQFILDANGWCYGTREVTAHVFGLDFFEHDSTARRSTSRALKRLVEKGLICERGPIPYYASEPGQWTTVEEVEASCIDIEFNEASAKRKEFLDHCYAKLASLGITA